VRVPLNVIVFLSVLAMTASAMADTEKREDRKVFAVGVNALSALQWGQTAQVEAGRFFSGIVRARVPHWALLYELSRHDPDWSLGIAGGARWYFRNILEKTFVGLGVEYTQEEWKYEESAHINDSRHTTRMIVPYIEFGYRWLIEYFHIGIGASFALSVWTRRERLLDDGSTQTKQYDPMPMPQLNLEIGFAL